MTGEDYDREYVTTREYVTKVEVVERDWRGLLAASSKVSPASVSGLLWLLLACDGCPGVRHAIRVFQPAVAVNDLILFFHNNQELASWIRQTKTLLHLVKDSH